MILPYFLLFAIGTNVKWDSNGDILVQLQKVEDEFIEIFEAI